MQADTFPSSPAANPSYAAVLRDLGTSATNLVRDELNLIKTEVAEAARNVGRHSAQAAAFGGLLALSILPFMAFVVIGLGKLLGDRYWLSSLIVALVCAVVGGPMAYRAFRKIKDDDLQLPHTKATLEKEAYVVQEKVEDVKDAAKGRPV
ncbi:MAG: phage holin family protein [Bdellovibrionales bacterium]